LEINPGEEDRSSSEDVGATTPHAEIKPHPVKTKINVRVCQVI